MAGIGNNFGFGNVGGPNPYNRPLGPNLTPGDIGQSNQNVEPKESFELGQNFAKLQVNPEILPQDVPIEPIIADAGVSSTKVSNNFSLSGPLGIDALNQVQKFSNVGTGITALNGLNSTVFTSVGGVNLASVNPLNPVSAPRVPTTSVATNGLDSNVFITSSGREISLNAPLTVKMPTTSVFTNGLESTSFTSLGGREYTLS